MANLVPIFSASEFVAVFNQSLEMMYPSVSIVGELASFKISRNQWVYFDLKDDFASVRFFGTTRQLPGPLEDGLLLEVLASPRMHPKYGLTLNIIEITVSGEGSIRRAQQLLEQKLKKEGLFDQARKRILPYPPESIGVISSFASAGLADFRKVISQRWGKLDIKLFDVQVQGKDSPKQIVNGLQYFNQLANPPEVLVIIRGGGSADDLSAYSSELVVRAVATSRIPTMVAIGHETDVSLAELASDARASTPTHVAQLLVPDRVYEKKFLLDLARTLNLAVESIINNQRITIEHRKVNLDQQLKGFFLRSKVEIDRQKEVLRLLNPRLPLTRGYAIVCKTNGQLVRSSKVVKNKESLRITLQDGIINAKAD